MTALSQRVREAADAIEELSAMHGYRYPEEAGWSALELRREAKNVEDTTPVTDYSGCSDFVFGDDE